MFTKLVSLLILPLLLFSGCSSNQPKDEKIDLETIKENREGLDYRDNRDNVFQELDETLQAWQGALRKRDHGYAGAMEQKLYELGGGHFSQLVAAIESGKPFERTVAVAVIGFSEDIRAIPYLIKAMQDNDLEIRKYAAFSLGHIGSNQTPMPALYQALEQEPDDEVRGMVAFAISQIAKKEHEEGALPHLLKAIADRAPQVRNHVVIALGKLEHPEGAKAILATALDDREAIVRQNAVWALGKMSCKEAIVPLVKRLRDPAPFVRQSAFTVLRKLTGKDWDNPQQWEAWAGVKQ